MGSCFAPLPNNTASLPVVLVESAAATEAESVEAAVGTVALAGTVVVARLCVARECVDLMLELYFLSLFSLWMSSGILGMLRFF